MYNSFVYKCIEMGKICNKIAFYVMKSFFQATNGKSDFQVA